MPPGATKPLDIVIYTEGLPISGDDPAGLSLGGSETAAVSMARALQRQGHQVAVCCTTERRQCKDGVLYLPGGELFPHLDGHDCDVFLSSRFHRILEHPIRANLIGLWHHDMPEGALLAWMQKALAKAAFSFFLSRFQRDEYERRFPGIARQGFLTSNAIDFDALRRAAQGVVRDKGVLRFIYASRPERGLDFLLDAVWPKIRQRYPSAELLVTTYASPADAPPLKRRYELTAQRVRQAPGVRSIGPLPRAAFWRETAGCVAVLYPTDMPEVSCMVALEAQALGVPVVTSGRFALSETVASEETLVREPWGSEAYVESFVDRVARLVEDDAFDAAVVDCGRRHVHPESHSWDALAAQWTELFTRIFTDRSATRRAGILRRLLGLSDFGTARHLVASEARPAEVFDAADLADLEAAVAARSSHPEADLLPPRRAGGGNALAREVGKSLERLLPAGNGCQGGSVLDLGGAAHPFLLPWLAGHPRAALLTAGLDADVEGGDGPLQGDVVVVGEVLQCVDDPAALLRRAQTLARRGLVGVLRRGPWKEGGPRWWHFTLPDLLDLVGHQPELAIGCVVEDRSPRGEALGWWIFSHAVDPGRQPGCLDLATKVLRTPPQPKLSATILVKNEEGHLRSCIESCAGVVDEVLLGDTGSTDLTIPIARSMGFSESGPARQRRKLFSIEFEDFSQARNALAEHATGDYLLWLDADEILVNGRGLRQWIDANLHYDGFCLEQRQALVDFKLDSEHPLRCFKRVAPEGALRWFGCIHEVVELQLNRGPERVLALPDVYLAHTGYLHADLRHRKAVERNFPLLVKDRLVNPGRKLGYILGMREHLSLAGLELSRSGGQMTRKAYRLLNQGHDIWEEHVKHFEEGYRRLGFEVAQGILKVLAHHRLPLQRTGRVPFWADISVAAHYEACQAKREESKRLFSSVAELREALDRAVRGAEAHLEAPPEPPDPIEIERAPQLEHLDLPPELFGLAPSSRGVCSCRARLPEPVRGGSGPPDARLPGAAG